MTLWIAQAVDPNSGVSDRADYFAVATGILDTSTKKIMPLDLLHGRFETTEQPYIVTREYQKWRDTEGASFTKVGIQKIFYETDLFNHLLKDGVVPLLPIDRRAGKGLGSHTKLSLFLNLQARYERRQITHPGLHNGSVWAADYGTHPWLQTLEDELLSLSWVDGKEIHKNDDAAEAWALVVEVLAGMLLTSYLSEPRTHDLEIGE